MPISRLEALLHQRALGPIEPHTEPKKNGAWFTGSRLTVNGLTLYWGQRQHVSGSSTDEIRLMRGVKEILLLCKDKNDMPRMMFGHQLTPGVASLTAFYETPPPPSMESVLERLVQLLLHPLA